MTASLFLELEITQRCPLQCTHCYSHSGPTAPHGTLASDDWRRIIDDAADLSGTAMIQFIGGEPTAHPQFPLLLKHAIRAGLRIEVFTNLFHVRHDWWDLYAHPNVSLATSYYSDRDDEHDTITHRTGSHARTRANIAEAVNRSIPIRAGIIDMLDGQRIAEARADLTALGVTNISVDRMRGVGRATERLGDSRISELCGRCGDHKAAITAYGDVYPCVLSRFLEPAGNVRHQPLRDILNGAPMRALVSLIPPRDVCNPECKPSRGDGADCAPAETETCNPSFCNPDSE